MPIKVVEANGTLVTDLSPLTNSPIETLDLDNTPIKDIGACASMKNLQNLDVGSTVVRDLRPLQGLSLEVFSIGNTGVKSLEPLCGMPLKPLYANYTLVEDLTPLKDMPLECLEYSRHTSEGSIAAFRYAAEAP